MSRKRSRSARRRMRRNGSHHRTFVAMVGGVLAVMPAIVASGGAVEWLGRVNVNTPHTRELALIEGFNPEPVQVNVDGSLPQAFLPGELPLSADQLPAAYLLPGGLLGIPATVLQAYRNAADIMSRERPTCHIDWALLASIGRIESNHARGGYVDKNGMTLEPILGPQLNGAGNFAPIPDTDHGVYDRDQVWDRAVGPMQFIPSTWRLWASDGNNDGSSDPNNIYDATLAAARYLCAGGVDLTNPDQLRSAILRYNNSSVYLAIVLAWADAYRKGVLPLPDSPVPVGAPIPTVLPGPAPVEPPAAPGASPGPLAVPPSTPGAPPPGSVPASRPATSSPPPPPPGPPASNPPPSSPPPSSPPPPTSNPPTSEPATSTPPTSTSEPPPPSGTPTPACTPTSQASPGESGSATTTTSTPPSAADTCDPAP